jgi:hypothetical protein
MKTRGFDSCLLMNLVLMVMKMVVGKVGVPKNEVRGMMEREMGGLIGWKEGARFCPS